MNDEKNMEVTITRGGDALFHCCEECSNLEMVDKCWYGTNGKHVYVFGHCKHWLHCPKVVAECEEDDKAMEEDDDVEN